MNDNGYPWINPIGGLGDALMVSGILKQLNDRDPAKKFNLIRRTKYTIMFQGHPAIITIGNPPGNVEIIKTDYWSYEKLGSKENRAYQILSRHLGLSTPAPEFLFFPGELIYDRILTDLIPWKNKNVIISPTSESPRKEMHPSVWHQVVKKLDEMGIGVIQVGKREELQIKNTFYVAGLTTPAELISLVSRADLIITVDNFIMHIAHMVGKPAVVIWGPTSSEVYGYEEQVHLQAPLDHCELRNKCLGPEYPGNYHTNCPLLNDHCMNKNSAEYIYKNALKILI